MLLIEKAHELVLGEILSQGAALGQGVYFELYFLTQFCDCE